MRGVEKKKKPFMLEKVIVYNERLFVIFCLLVKSNYFFVDKIHSIDQQTQTGDDNRKL